MIPSLSVKNFRLFRSLRVSHLSRVNLIVGKNSSGKSAFLESLQLFAASGAPSVLLDLVSSRDGYWESEIGDADEESQTFEHPFRSLFYGYHLPQPGEQGIEIGPLQGDRISVQTQFYTTVEEGEIIRRVAVPPRLKDDGVNVELNLEVRENGKVVFVAPAAIDMEGLNRFRRRPPSPFGTREQRHTYQFVSAQSVLDSRVAAYWDKVHLTDNEPDVIRALNLIQPGVAGLAFVGEGSDRPPYLRARSRRVPIVKLLGIAERIPLKGLGDGITRVLEIVLALVNSRDGFLFVDEIENGLHWTVMPDLWKIVFQLAERLNIQVFATTHSRDCIEGFQAVWGQRAEDGSFHRLDSRADQGVQATEYNLTTLSDAIKAEVEVR
jgi:hypothetical protein